MSAALRIISRSALRAPMQTRAFSAVPVARADIVTDMYLKGLKDFKPTAAKANDAEGQVKNWAIPKAPQAPETASNISSELSAYDSAEVESQSADSSAASSESEGDWFELDTKPDQVHH